MVSITHRRGAGRRGLAAVADTGADLDDAELVLTPAQQEYLTVHGFGPAAVHADFGDPEVRARLVAVLRECGALAPAPVTPLPARRHRAHRRHLRRAG
jgi:hypothetical protein